MEFLGVWFMFAVLAAIVLLPVALIVTDIRYLVKKEEAPIFEFVAFILGSAYMFWGLKLWDLPGYLYYPLYLFNDGACKGKGKAVGRDGV